MERALRRSLGSHAQHTHSLEDHTWSIQQSTTTHTKHFHNIQQQHEKAIATQIHEKAITTQLHIWRWMITNKLKINDSKTEFIVFRSPQLKCNLSGLSVNVGESMITLSSKVRDLEVIFLNFDDHIPAICRSTHFHIRNIGKIRNLLSYDACSTIMYALISCRLDYCNYIMYNVP